MILDRFNVLMSKINFKIKINYFDVFQNKNTLKNNDYYNFKHYFIVN